jgi:outer membrane protein OmpA-like peptidoglycan-associated protein
MKRMILFAMLVIALLAYNPAHAQFGNPNLALGFAAGGAQGHNSSADEWGMQYRGYLQYKIISPVLLGQLGVGYTKLQAKGVYSAETAMADNRLLFVPFSSASLNPFLYAGFGVSKAIDRSNSDFLPMIPLGVGIQTRLGGAAILQLSGGYNLSLSDKLDGRQRSDSDLNDVTNKKQDGFFGFSAGFMFGGSSMNADRDHDGLTDRVEKELGTDPKNPDTDGDALQDGAEVNQHRTDPLRADSDADGLNDGEEVNRYRTNPSVADSDNDGLKDGDEVNTGRNGHDARTDPLKADTDGDGLNDGAEVTQYFTNPTAADTDGDGLSDGDEVTKYKSDPLKPDTDGDGLSDGAEVNQYKTGPTKADTDGDGLSDGDEVNKYKSDPLKIDTDRGGTNDGAEVRRGTNVLNPKDDIQERVVVQERIVLEKGKKVVLHGINFEFGKATLTSDSKSILEEAYDALVASPEVQVEISGHTDFVGSDAYNQKLSLRRAQAVKNWLVQRGTAANRMKTIGKGESEPLADNGTDAGRAENRRIEFYVQQ